MYLKSIEVQGFKSFANKILFQFHNGITSIVGPNGSGKSNVADAVRWVLGEQSARQLRGANMQDVIFSGTENRKPLGFAYVAITLDNTDHQLPIDYQEVTVARRVYRSGESEYKINGTACRLKDINELFYDTGIGKEGYSIIGQGQIDKILSGKPEERRELFDEAAGIVKFKKRKNTAQKKLEAERQNLTRVSDILSEMENQLKPLERQAETAKTYLKKREDLKICDANMFLLEMEQIRKQLKEHTTNLDISEADLNKTRESYESTRIEYDKAEADILKLEEKIEAKKNEINQSAMHKQQMEGQINVLKEQINTAKMTENHLNSRLGVVEADIKSRQEQQLGEESQLAKLKTQLAEAARVEEESRLEADAIAACLSHTTQQMDEKKSEIIDLLNVRATTKAKIQRYDTMLEQIQIRKASISQKFLSLKSEESEQEEQISQLQKEYNAVSADISQLSTECSSYEEKINQIQKELLKQNHNVEIGQTAYHREASRLESLKNISERYDGYGNSIRRVMEQRGKEPGIHGVVADIIKVEKTYEIAIETALGGSIQNIVTEDEHTAKRMIDYLKKNKYGRATFLPLTSMGKKNGFQNAQALKEAGVIGIASTLVKTEPKYDGLVAYLLGRTIVAENIDYAIALARKYHYSLRIVTLEGESLSPGGSMTGGAFRNSSNLLGRKREMEEHAENVRLLKKDLDEMQQAIDNNRRIRNTYREQITQLNEKLKKEYIRQNTAKMKMSQAEAKKVETKSGFTSLNDEIKDIETQTVQIKNEQQKIQQELDLSLDREKELENTIAELQKRQEQEKAEQNEYARKAEEIHLQLAAVQQKDDFAHQNILRIKGELRQLMDEQKEVAERIATGSADAGQKETEIDKIRTAQETVREQCEILEKSIQGMATEKEQISKIQKAFFTKREELSERITVLDKECFRLKTQLEKLEESKESKINYMWEEYELTTATAEPLRKEEYQNALALKKETAALKNEIRSLGNINVNAIDDYKEISERYEFLKTQHDDLIEAEKALLEVIEDLDTGMRTQFEEKFALIQKEFDKTFKELFGGGKGSLELIEDEDILEAGIRIISQPPGKKLQNMMQMSGGEKALTAIALLFAIQNLKPSPFCLLDEIEAALDESNVARYAKYLHKLTKNTQFIIITHRRGTMAVADRLYGITMQEKGISTLVSVNLIEDEIEE